MGPRRFFSSLLSLCFFSVSMLSALPVITNVSPSVGPSIGGTAVTLTGSGFTGATAINFGTAPAASFIILSDTNATAVTPPHTPQVTTVFITTPSGTSESNDNSFFTFQGDWQAYVTNGDDDTVSVIDVQEQIVTTTIPVDIRPSSVALTPDGSQAYVLNFPSTVTVIDTATNTVINTFPVGLDPTAIAITPDGTKAYVVNRAPDSTVTVIDIATQTIITTISVGNDPLNIAITPDSSKAYIANSSDNTVSVIDTSTNTVISTIPVGLFPIAITTTPDGLQTYVVNSQDSSVSVIDTSTDTVIDTIPVGASPRSIAITTDGTKAYIGNVSDSTVSVIDIATRAVIATIPVGNNPYAIAITPNSLRAYVLNGNDDTVSVIDTSTNTVIATIPVGQFPTSLAITPDGQQVYVTNNSENTVSVIDTATNTVINTILVGGEPTMVGITPDQAPLARFTKTVQGIGLPTIFDASQSVSPTGTIASYFWDFGDGNTLSTSSPLVIHIYTTPGTFTVILTVTNTAGTSLTQILGLNSYSSGGGVVHGGSPTIYNNGGPTATTRMILTLTAPPATFTGCISKNKFLNKTEYFLNATWTSSPTPDVAFFRIYQNDILIAEISASSPFVFKKCLRSKNEASAFAISAVSSQGMESPQEPITIIKTSCCSR